MFGLQPLRHISTLPISRVVDLMPAERREQSFVMRGLVMHWPSVLASANPLREGQRFV